ncbi:hypothetical protein [Rhizobium bangladeshense]|uniref:hypothetical protein n=1 Tax=Rhizobium bangladeshense TaxID=1138189 RepID=UPI0007E5B53C|nr:hypothetical protein [Rhizobium bangladeshense]
MAPESSVSQKSVFSVLLFQEAALPDWAISCKSTGLQNVSEPLIAMDLPPDGNEESVDNRLPHSHEKIASGSCCHT